MQFFISGIIPAHNKYKSGIFLFLLILLLSFIIYFFRVNSPTSQYKKLIPFEIRGIAYNPVSIDTGKLDPSAPKNDIPKLVELGANTLSTYNLGEFDWENKYDLKDGVFFYDQLVPTAEEKNLNIIVGYFSNATTDWTDQSSVERVTRQFQNLVNKTKNKKSTLMYLIGNEIFEKLQSVDQRVSYAKWIGEMVNWVHLTDPAHPVTYADDSGQHGLKYLQTFSPEIDIYSINNYEWDSKITLSRILENITTKWPGKSVLIHEWGVDSWDHKSGSENEGIQAARVNKLLIILNNIYKDKRFLILGNVYFEYSDQWDKTSVSNKQDVSELPEWICNTCFDKFIDEDYLGIFKGSAEGESKTRIKKEAFDIFKNNWNVK